MYNERYLQTVRLASQNNEYYIHARCRAEMRKSVVYNVDLNVDSDGVILQCQCECAVGLGPHCHCKHVCALLYGLSIFSVTSEILVQEMCTEQLQTFHKCKKFMASPLKTSALTLRKKYQKSKSSVFKMSNFDPRPKELKNLKSYPSFFRNTCLNFSSYSPQMPILQTIPPANLYASVNDHDYLLQNPEDTCLNDLLVASVTDEQVSEIEIITRGQSSTSLWFEERKKRIQSSVFGKICKATSKTDQHKLAHSIIYPTSFSSPSVRYGKQYENTAIKQYEQIKKQNTIECGIFVSKSHPFLVVHQTA